MNEKKKANSLDKRLLTGGIILLISTCFMFVLGNIFPYTGLQAIVTYPATFILNSIVVLLGVYMTRKLAGFFYILVWTLAFFLAIHFVIYLFPQDFGPSVYEVLSRKIFHS